MNHIRAFPAASRTEERLKSCIQGCVPFSPQTLARVFFFLLVCVSLGLGLARAEELTVTDSLGREIRLKVPVRRIVVLNTDALESIRILKAEDRVVGVCSKLDADPEFWGHLSRLPQVGLWREPDFEAISVLEPDLILAYCTSPGQALEQFMTPQGFPILRLDFFRIHTLEKEMLTLGRVLGQEKEAERFRDWHHRVLECIEIEMARVGRRPRVYMEQYLDYRAAGKGSGGAAMCELAGGRNIAADSTIPALNVTPEWVLGQNPEVIVRSIFLPQSGYNLNTSAGLNRIRDAILKRPAWNHIPAVASGRVHILENSIWSGPAIVIGTSYMFRWFHPELPLKVDPRALHREYVETFLDIPFKGKYVSDPLTMDGPETKEIP